MEAVVAKGDSAQNTIPGGLHSKGHFALAAPHQSLALLALPK